MAGHLPQSFIDDLLSRIDVVDVVGDYVPLRKAGKDFQGLCPFHNEKTPSFTVSQSKQFYHCFGCGANGSAISFLMEHANMDFIEAIKELASRVGMQLPEGESRSDNRPSNQPIYNLLEQATKFYSTQLRQHATAPRAIDYLKNRGLSGEVAAVYNIGFAPSGWDNLLTALGKSDETMKLLARAGMVIEKDDGKRYDRFRDRIIFPIRDYKGRVIGFGGRVLGEGEPKYLNSPETPVFHKGRELYGLFQARKRCKELTSIIVVEGYMDVVSLAQFGINNAVATLGTATTPDHLQRLFRTTHNITFCFDGDKAGHRAAWKALETALPLLKDGYAINFLFMPEGEDPDSMVRQHGKAYFEDKQNLTALSHYLFSTLQQQTDQNTMEGRARLVELAKPLISKIPTGALRSLMQQQLASLSHINPGQIDQLLPDAQPTTESRLPAQQKRSHSSAKNPIDKAIQLLLQHPCFALEVASTETLGRIQQQTMMLLIALIKHIKDHPETSTGQLIEHWRNSETSAYFMEMLAIPSPLTKEQQRTEFLSLIDQLIKSYEKQQRSAILQSTSGKITSEFIQAYKQKSADP